MFRRPQIYIVEKSRRGERFLIIPDALSFNNFISSLSEIRIPVAMFRIVPDGRETCEPFGQM
jgi:hypothetical protein